MNKYLKNIIYIILLIIFPFFIINLKTYNLIYTIPITFIIFYSLLDYRYPLLFIPGIIFYQIYLFNNILPLLFFTIGLNIILRLYIIKKPILIILYTPFIVFLINLVELILINTYNLNLLLLNSFLAIIFISFLFFFIKPYKLKNDYNFKIINIEGLLFICFICMIIGSINTPYFNFKVLIFTLPIIFFNILKKTRLSFVFSVLNLIIFYFLLNIEIEICLLFLFISIFTMSKYYSFILILLLFIDINYFNYYDYYLDIYLIIFLSIFELIRVLIIDLPLLNQEETLINVNKSLNNNFCDQIIKFSSFLDDFSRNFIIQTDEKNKINEAFNKLVNSYCIKCPNRYICFGKYKPETYIFLKNALMYGEDLHYKKNSSDIKDFFKKCKYTDEIIIKANNLKNKYNIFNSNNPFEKTLSAQINGISNTLRQYVLDIKTKEEIPINKFVQFKNELLNLNYNIILYDIKKSYVDDFLIEIGIDYSDIEILSNILLTTSFQIFGFEVSLEIKKHESSKVTYYHIFPKKLFNINYGYGQIAKNNLNIKGDNYLIKNLNNGAFYACLSDGMGHGINAYQESKLTISMIDKIIDFDINSSTSFNILNTFYSLKDNFDNYATLDLIEIHKNKKKALIYKMGSTFTYVVKNKEIISIANSNLPFGINDLIITEEIDIEINDLIILMTDGVTDNINENKLKEYILLNRFKEPQKLVYDLLQLIERENKNVINDDMSIIILKIEKN